MMHATCACFRGGTPMRHLSRNSAEIMARKLKWSIAGLILCCISASAYGEDVPQLRTLEGRESVIAMNSGAKPAKADPPKENNAPKIAPNDAFGLPKAPVASKAVKKSLADKVQAILNEKVLKSTQVGVQIYDMDSGDVVYSHNADKLLKPASNTKLLTTAAALSILGPDHQFESAVYITGKIEKGTLKGDLHLHIDHDFTWSTRFYDAGDVPMRGLIAQIKSAGINKISGNVIVSGHVVYGGLATGTLSTIIHLKRAGNQFGALLKKSRINYAGLSIHQTAKPEGKKIATWLSPVLSEAIVPLNRVSHNEYADMLMIAMGYHTSGKNTYEAGSKAVKNWLKEAGLPTKGIEIFDGSGLSHDNRMSADFFTKLVEYMLKSPAGREWAASMAISGYDGTYGARLAIDDGKGRVYAKSGTLRDTISGSGFFVNRYDGHTYAFSILVNGMRNKKITRQSIDRIVRVFLGNHLNAQIPQAPRMTSLVAENGRPVARWNTVKDAQGYRIYGSKDGSQWNLIRETTESFAILDAESSHVRVTSVAKSGIESLPSLIFSYRPGKHTMTIVEEALCRSDEAMRPANHFIAHERPLAAFVDNTWGIETVRTLENAPKDAVLFHSVACSNAITWNQEIFEKAVSQPIPVIVNIVDAHVSADASGACTPTSGKVLGCFGEAVVTKDRRMGERAQNLRLRKAAGTGSARPSSITTWNKAKPLIEMSSATVAAQEKTSSGSMTVIGFDIQALDSQKTMDALWKSLKIK